MPYPRGHRAQTRKQIVESARRMFNLHGFENVSIDAIMADAGLTRGGFYGYFKSKSDLYIEALGCFFTDPNWKNQWEGVEVDLSSPDVGAQIVRAYLSRQHLEDVENSCPMVALPNDVARSGEKVREAFETVFRAMVAILAREVKSPTGKSEDAAMAIGALCIGGMVVARAINGGDFSDRLRDAAMRAALSLGGWSRPAVKQRRAKTAPIAPRPKSRG
jgi:AcrR family transcriptional regulator